MKLDPDQQAFRDAIWNPDKLIVFCNSATGSGKTTVAVATAVLMYRYGLYDGISFVVCPCNENRQGFLPGNIEEKTLAYATPLYQALMECGEQPERAVVQNGAASIKEGAYIEFMPDTYLRGMNFKNRVVILDEFQNASCSTAKKVLTRAADSSKVIVIGHSGQRDAYNSGRSAFEQYIDHFAVDERAAVCALTRNYRGWVSSHADNIVFE